jgi:heme/copper-type cytochrome/quinol oxidase subunit 2
MEIFNKIHGLFVSKVYAQSLGSELSNSIGGLGDGSISNENELVDQIVKIAVPLAVICVVVLVVYAGYMLMSSQGNPDKLKEGKEILTNAIIGFLVVLLSVAILLLISNSLGLGIYN